MCPSDHTDSMRASLTDHLKKVWKELNLDLTSDVYKLDDCQTFGIDIGNFKKYLNLGIEVFEKTNNLRNKPTKLKVV